jgi:hypothetical protein
LHFALALCDWIGHRSVSFEAPEVLNDFGRKDHTFLLLANDFRNRERLRHSSGHGLDLGPNTLEVESSDSMLDLVGERNRSMLLRVLKPSNEQAGNSFSATGS